MTAFLKCNFFVIHFLLEIDSVYALTEVGV